MGKLLIALAVAYACWRLWKDVFGLAPPKPRPRPATPTWSEAEARALLGVGLDADRDTIRAAHRRLMTDAHPDRGGSAERARELNAARDLLLGGR